MSSFRANGQMYDLVTMFQQVIDNALHAGEPGSGHPLETADFYDYFPLVNNGNSLVFSGPCVFGGYQIMGAAGAGTVNVFDNTTNSGQIMVPPFTVAAAAVNVLAPGRRCLNGITVNITALPTAGQILIFYKAL